MEKFINSLRNEVYMVSIQFLPRVEGERLAKRNNPQKLAFDVSSYAPAPYNSFSPFSYSPQFQIPVPGIPGRIAHSVESIWQGLKVIDGVIDDTLFTTHPHKRRGVVDGHLYNGRLLEVEEARWKIYLPAYHYFVDKYVPTETVNSLLSLPHQGKEISLYDVQENGNISNPEPLAHASVLALYLNLKIAQTPWKPSTKQEHLLSDILNDDNKSIEDKASDLLASFSDDKFRKVFIYTCIEHPQNIDQYHLGQVLSNLALK